MAIINSFINGKQPGYFSRLKNFPISLTDLSSWNYKQISFNNKRLVYLTPTYNKSSLYIEGDLVVKGTIYGEINTPSDIRLEKNIENIDLTLVDRLLQIEPKQYTLNSDKNDKTHFGVIAQDLEKQFPNLVTSTFCENNNIMGEYKAVNYIELIPLLLAKVQDLQKQIDELKESKK